MIGRGRSEYQAALAAVAREDVADFEKADMLVEMAMGLQGAARCAEDFGLAVELYEQALGWAAQEPELTRARIRARQATALNADPQAGEAELRRARSLLEQAAPVLRGEGLPAEAAEADLNLGLVLQALAGMRVVALTEAIAAYQRALQVFTGAAYPAEFAILHNNLATAYLAMGDGSADAKLREALAVRAFETALECISLIDHPREFAMLQNNLGNALQYAASGHPVENNLRAMAAYTEALRVRTQREAPVEYANTLANLGNCLSNLPAAAVDFDPRQRALECFAQAEQVFRQFGQLEKAEIVSQSRTALESP